MYVFLSIVFWQLHVSMNSPEMREESTINFFFRLHFSERTVLEIGPLLCHKGCYIPPLPLPPVIENTLSQVSTISPNEIRSGLPCFVGGTTKQQFWQETKTKVFFSPVGHCKHSAKYAVLCDGKT